MALSRQLATLLALATLALVSCETAKADDSSEQTLFVNYHPGIAWPFYLSFPVVQQSVQIASGDFYPAERSYVDDDDGEGDGSVYSDVLSILASKYNEKLEKLKISDQALAILDKKPFSSSTVPEVMQLKPDHPLVNEYPNYHLFPFIPLYVATPAVTTTTTPEATTGSGSVSNMTTTTAQPPTTPNTEPAPSSTSTTTAMPSTTVETMTANSTTATATEATSTKMPHHSTTTNSTHVAN